VKSDGWTVIRNQRTNDTSSLIKVASASTTAASVPKEIPKAAAAPSVWGTFLEEEDIDMLSLLAARDASLALSQNKDNKVVPTVKKEKAIEKINASVNQSESESEHLRTPLLPRALACWKIDAICDPCPYGSDILIHAALHGEEEEEERSAQSYEAMQHVQQMLAGYIAASEAEEEGDGDQGRDDPALLALLKSEMTITKSTHSREKEKEKGTERGAEKERGKSGADNITNNNSSSSSSSSSSKREGHGAKSEHDKSEEGERDGDTSILNKSDCRSRIESSFQAAVSHAPSQVARLYYTILFYYVLFYSTLICPISSHMILFCSDRFSSILFYSILSCPVPSYSALLFLLCSRWFGLYMRDYPSFILLFSPLYPSPLFLISSFAPSLTCPSLPLPLSPPPPKPLHLLFSQVVRFAYGGSPLWCTYPPPVNSNSVPKCVCGAERVFEMQLMPG
jgi:Programmed cell death protein 2, C-terminal putative domain